MQRPFCAASYLHQSYCDCANQTPSHVVRDLNFMIKERMLPYGKIENGVLMITSLHRESVKPAEIQQDIGSKSVECSGCGARTVISHQEEKSASTAERSLLLRFHADRLNSNREHECYIGSLHILETAFSYASFTILT